ncbi:MAG: SDR family oxidoreductase [Clostridia bacterium]|nr:SDR family oxidoreductase [Clostridia bacterium]
MKEFEGKYCIVTGSARGVGRQVAEKFAAQGARLALMDINAEMLDKTAAEIAEQYNTQVIAVPCDLSKKAEIDRAMEAVTAAFPHVNVLAFCAGIVTSRLIIDIPEEEWDRVMGVNLKSVFMLSSAVAHNMIDNKVENGKIVIISSQASKIGEVGNGAYCVSKAGINMLVQVLGLELAPYGICINAVCPGCINTEMIQKVFRERSSIEGMTPEEYEKFFTGQIPMGRLAEPEEIADFMLFLASEKANYITGVSHTIAGGKTLI